MEAQTGRAKLVAPIIVVLVAAGVYLLWHHDRKEVEDTTSAPADYVSTRVRAVKTARSTQVTFDNPEMGLCPVCRENVNYESFANIGHKNYALCSDECAQKLQARPNDYLPAAQP